MLPLSTLPRLRRFTRAEYHRAAEAGVFGPDERLELIHGEVVAKMSPQKRPHALAISLVEETLRRAFGAGFTIQVQLPLALDEHSEPEPDIAVVRGHARDYPDHPSTALLLVEIADTTLAYDRTVKAALYAAAGIPEYWIVNLGARVLEVHRDPAMDAPEGVRYRRVSSHAESEQVAPEARAGCRIRVADQLP